MTNKPLEKSIENVLRQAVEAEGGVCLKWVCPGHRGVPDRMILFPGGIIAFVELKRPGAKVKAGGLQEWWHNRLWELGFRYYEISTAEEARDAATNLSQESFIAISKENIDHDPWDDLAPILFENDD